jgi:hypothetical protein
LIGPAERFRIENHLRRLTRRVRRLIRPRTTIAGLIVIVTLVAVALAALRAADDAWDVGTFGLTLLILLASVLLAVHRRGRRRAYWLGFSLFGWAYLAMSLVPSVEARLPTSKGLAFLDSQVPGRVRTFAFTVSLNGQPPPPGSSVAFSPSGGTLAAASQGSVRFWDATTGMLLSGPGGTTENFVRIGHSLLAVVFGLVGGWLSRRLQAGAGWMGDGGLGESPQTARPSDRPR